MTSIDSAMFGYFFIGFIDPMFVNADIKKPGAEAHLEISGTSTIELFCEDSSRKKDVNYFCKKLHRRSSTSMF